MGERDVEDREVFAVCFWLGCEAGRDREGPREEEEVVGGERTIDIGLVPTAEAEVEGMALLVLVEADRSVVDLRRCWVSTRSLVKVESGRRPVLLLRVADIFARRPAWGVQTSHRKAAQRSRLVDEEH